MTAAAAAGDGGFVVAEVAAVVVVAAPVAVVVVGGEREQDARKLADAKFAIGLKVVAGMFDESGVQRHVKEAVGE
jgi:hypothetical protein